MGLRLLINWNRDSLEKLALLTFLFAGPAIGATVFLAWLIGVLLSLMHLLIH